MIPKVAILTFDIEVKISEVYFNPYADFSNPNVSSMYLKSRNAIVFNDRWLDSANELEILATCFHETRHAFNGTAFNQIQEKIKKPSILGREILMDIANQQILIIQRMMNHI